MDDEDADIIARGEWAQDSRGGVTYYPPHIRPQRRGGEPYEGWGGPADLAPDAAPDADAAREANHDPAGETRDGYRPRSDTVWDRARRDFLAGDSAAAVCDRYDLALGTFKSRSAREGWRRSDQPEPEIIDLDDEPPVGPAEQAQMAAQALIRARRALSRGRAAEAGSWLRVHAQLARLIAAEAAAAAPPEKREPKAPDRTEILRLQMNAVREIAATAAASPNGARAHAGLSRLMGEVMAMSAADLRKPRPETIPAPEPEPDIAAEPETDPEVTPAADPDSDHSDHSDPVSSSASASAVERVRILYEDAVRLGRIKANAEAIPVQPPPPP